MTTGKSIVFRIGDVEVRVGEFSVVKAGNALAVEPKAFRVLLFLLNNPRRVVTKEELLSAVWGDAAVTENSLTRSILKLRRALDDDAHDPRFIETVSTIGYRLICSVSVVEDSDSMRDPVGNEIGSLAAEGIPASTSEPVAPAAPNQNEAGLPAMPTALPAHSRRTILAGRRLLWVLCSLVLIAAFVTTLWFLRRPLPQPHIASYRQLTHDNRVKAMFAADSSRLYLSFYPEAQSVGEVSTAGGPIVNILTGFPNPWLIDATPDRTRLLVLSEALFRNAPSPPGLWSVNPVGNVQKKLASGDIDTAAWSPDGSSAVFTRINGDSGDIEIVSADGTGEHKIASTNLHSDHAMMDRISWSPDGRLIRFDAHDRIYQVAPDGSGLRPFLPNWQPRSILCCGRWTRDGSFFLFLEWQSPSPGYPLFAPSQLWALDERRGILRRPSREPVQLTAGPTRWGGPIPSVDGTRIFERGVILNGQLERSNLKTHQLEPLFGGISAEFVAYSHDGNSVAYVTFPEGILWRANRDGTNPTQLTNPPFYPTQPRWSPDGKDLVCFGLDARGLYKIYLISAQGGTPRPLFPDNPDRQANPDWSPDGKKVVFTWNDVSANTSEIRIYDLATHQFTKIPGSENMDSARWSPDGQWLTGLSDDTTELFVYNFRNRHWTSLQKGDNGYPMWSHDGKFVYFFQDGVDGGVFRIRPTGGQSERVVDLKGFRFISYFGEWVGLDPDDAALILRNIGSDDIYALNLEWK